MFLLYCILFGENWCCGGQSQGRQDCCGNAAPAAEERCPCTYRICCRKECCCQKQVCGNQKTCCGQGNGYGCQGSGYGAQGNGYDGRGGCLHDGCGCSLSCCTGYGRHGSGGVCCDECYYRRQYALCGRCCE